MDGDTLPVVWPPSAQFEGALPPIIPRGLFSLNDFAAAKSRVRPGA